MSCHSLVIVHTFAQTKRTMSYQSNIETGLKGKKEEVVTKEKSAAAVGSGLLDVYATPSMIALMEHTASTTIQPLLAASENSVGSEVHIFHIKPTPIGMKVTCEAEVIEVSGRKVTFKVTAYDEKGEIGNGKHARFIIDTDKFMKKLSE